MQAVLKFYLPDLMVVPSASIRPPSAAPVAAEAEATVEAAAVVEEAMVAEAVAEVTTVVVEAMVSANSCLFMNVIDGIRWRLRQPWRRR